MFSDRRGNPTDDSNEWLFGHETTFDYDPAPDFEGMEYDDFRRGPKCGGPGFQDRDTYVPGCPGCGCCDPVSGEDKPYGWGLEPSECDDVLRIARELRGNIFLPEKFNHGGPDAFALAVKWSGFNVRLSACSDRKWERICDRAEYTRWAEKVTGRRKAK